MCVVLQTVVPMKHDFIQGSRAVSQDDVYVCQDSTRCSHLLTLHCRKEPQDVASKRKKFHPGNGGSRSNEEWPILGKEGSSNCILKQSEDGWKWSQLENLKGFPWQGQMMRIATPAWSRIYPSSLSHSMCSSLSSMRRMRLSPTMPISICEAAFFQLMPTLPPTWSEPDSCPEHLQGHTRSPMIRWSTQSGSTGNGQHHSRSSAFFHLHDSGSVRLIFIPNLQCSYRPQTGQCVVEWWPEDPYTGGSSGLLWNLLWGSNHEERELLPWPDCRNEEGRIHIHSDHGRGGIKSLLWCVQWQFVTPLIQFEEENEKSTCRTRRAPWYTLAAKVLRELFPSPLTAVSTIYIHQYAELVEWILCHNYIYITTKITLISFTEFLIVGKPSSALSNSRKIKEL